MRKSDARHLGPARKRPIGAVAAAGAALALLAPWGAAQERFTLPLVVPEDVFLCAAGRANPERAFLDEYWKGVGEAFAQSGVLDDVMELIGSFLDEEQRGEVQRLKDLAADLLNGVDWDDLGGVEWAFAERMPGVFVRTNNVNIGPPDMVLLLRGSADGSARNYEGLVAIQRAVVNEINRFAFDGQERLTLAEDSRDGLRLSSFNLLQLAPQAPPMPLSIGWKGDVIFISFGAQMERDVAALLTQAPGARSLGGQERYRSAFAELPAAEDVTVLVDFQRLMADAHRIKETVLEAASRDVGRDHWARGARPASDADRINGEALRAYRRGEYADALALVEKGLEQAPDDSLLMYNKACFKALLGDADAALEWLEKAVAAGAHAPRTIANDDDLKSLRDDPRYQAALERARQGAAQHGATDMSGVRRVVDRLLEVPQMIDYIAVVERTEGYSTYEDARLALRPGFEQAAFYPVLAKGSALSGFERYLPVETAAFAVAGCPDLNALYAFLEETARTAGPPGEELLRRWADFQKEIGFDVRKDLLDWFDGDSVSVTLNEDFGGASVWMLKVRNEAVARDRLASGLSMLSEHIGNLAAKQPMLAMLMATVGSTTHAKLEGFHSVRFAVSPTPIVCGVADGHLIIGTSEDAVATCLATAAGEHPNIRRNERIMREALIPTGPFSEMSYADARDTGETLAQVVESIAMAGGMVTMVIPEPRAQRAIGKVLGILGKLAPVARKIDFFKSTATCTTYANGAWHTRSVTHYVSPESHRKSD